MNRCPSCGGVAATRLDSIRCTDLAAGYALPYLGIPIEPLLPPGQDRLAHLRCDTCDLRWFDPAPAGDPAFYEALQRHDWYYQADKPEYTFAARQIADGERVLEVGCGRGAFGALLRDRVEYRGLEFNDEAIRKARDAGLEVSDARVEDEARRSRAHYDVVCHFQVLEHVGDVLTFMTACVGALRPGGLLIVAVPAEDSFLALAGDAWLNMPPHHLTRWTDGAMRHLFARLGVDVEQVWHEPVASYHQAWYADVMCTYGLMSLLGRRPALRSGLAARGARRMARIPGVASWLQRRGERGFAHAGRGHTVCFVGRRRIGADLEP